MSKGLQERPLRRVTILQPLVSMGRSLNMWKRLRLPEGLDPEVGRRLRPLEGRWKRENNAGISMSWNGLVCTKGIIA